MAKDARSIVEKSQETVKLKGVEAITRMTIFDKKGRKRVRQIAQVSKLYDNGKTEKKLLRFLAPAEVKGTGFLVFDYEKKDDDMWLFMPALRKTRRIISSEKAKSFMGSEFSYSDINLPTIGDFKYKLLGEEKVKGQLCWVIEMIPNNDDIADENGFSKKITYIAQKDNVVRRSIYHDLDTSLHKEMNVLSVKELDPKNQKYRPTHMVMVNKQNGRQSELIVEKIQYNPKVKDNFFTTRYLERP